MSKHLSRLRNLEGAVTAADGEEALANCLHTPSPSVNWALAQAGFGLPYGCGMVLYGPPKGGKSVFLNGIIGQMHKDDPGKQSRSSLIPSFCAKFQMNSTNLK